MIVYRDKQQVKLSDGQLIASGGEGSAYKVGDEAFKIYHKPIDRTFLDKMSELSPLVTLPNVVAPRDPLFDKSGELVGYVMGLVQNASALPLFFTTSYLKRNGFTAETIVSLAKRLLDTADSIHQSKILVVDANEFNFLVKNSGQLVPYFIDVDSYQTPSFPATAIMATIQDYASKKFSELTDWYSFGVLAFQLLVGIHPYKGTARGFDADDIAARCRAHVSVLNKNVRYPKAAVRPIDDVPVGYRAWFQAMFEGGERLPPPADPGAVAAYKPDAVIVSASIKTEQVFGASSVVYDMRVVGGRVVVSGKNFVTRQGSTTAPLIMTETDRPFPLMGSRDLIAVYVKERHVWAKVSSSSGELQSDVSAEKLFFVDDRLYAIYGSIVQEINATAVGGNDMLVTYNPMRVPENSSRIMTGVVYVDVFGRPNFLIPYGFKLSMMFHAPETDGYKIVDAFYANCVLIVIGSKNGRYDRFTFKFAISGSGLTLVDHDVERDVLLEEINATVLNNGMLVEVVGDDLRLSAKGSVQRKVVTNIGLPAGTSLRTDGAKVYYIFGNNIYSITMK
jgi:hypothetical protein